jgi:hypothetical protein
MTTTCEADINRYHRIMLADLKVGEQAFPIYYICTRWSESVGDSTNLPPHRTAGLPIGRCFNSTGWSTMFREVRDLEEIEAECLRDWWPKYVMKHPDAVDVDILVRFVRWEVWCESWFSHWSFDVGMDDAAVLASFGRYVDRVECAIECERYDGIEHPAYSLMGAEDRWRWHGCVGGDPKGEHTDPPCRCAHCKKNGLIRIDH